MKKKIFAFVSVCLGLFVVGLAAYTIFAVVDMVHMNNQLREIRRAEINAQIDEMEASWREHDRMLCASAKGTVHESIFCK